MRVTPITLIVLLLALPSSAAATPFVRGDVNADGVIDVSDALAAIGWLFFGDSRPSCLASADVNADGAVDISDPVRLLNFLFLGAPPPPGPHPDCGEDATATLGCEFFVPCGPPAAPGGFRFLRINEQGRPEFEHELTGIAFVHVPGGAFDMGAPEDECESEPAERPLHRVEVSSFLLARTEVSQRQWERATGERPSYFQGGLVPPDVDAGDLPVEQVSWHDVSAFCEATGLELPTEAQWELACRAGTRTPFTFGETISTDRANYNGSQPYCGGEPGEFREMTVPVGTFEPNGFGLHNMPGNVFEWCRDSFDAGFYSSSEASGADPVSLGDTPRKSARGGCFFHRAHWCRSAFRAGVEPTTRISHVGFRPAASLRDVH